MFVYPIDARGAQKVSKISEKIAFHRKIKRFHYKNTSKKRSSQPKQNERWVSPLTGIPTLAVLCSIMI